MKPPMKKPIKMPMKIIWPLNFVLALSILGCSSGQPKIVAVPNESASLAGQLPADPLQWRVITSMVDRADSTMSTLYGNDIAAGYARTHAQHDYPSGSEISLVTWTQQDDPRWFGASIPKTVRSVEFVTVKASADGRISYSYEKYEGAPLKRSSDEDSPAPSTRAAFLISQRAAVMP